MKKTLTSIFLLLGLTGYSQSKTINYLPTDEIITNPEREALLNYSIQITPNY